MDCACDAVTTVHPPGAATGRLQCAGKAAAPASVSGICGYRAAIPRPPRHKKRKTRGETEYLRTSFSEDKRLEINHIYAVAILAKQQESKMLEQKYKNFPVCYNKFMLAYQKFI